MLTPAEKAELKRLCEQLPEALESPLDFDLYPGEENVFIKAPIFGAAKILPALISEMEEMERVMGEMREALVMMNNAHKHSLFDLQARSHKALSSYEKLRSGG